MLQNIQLCSFKYVRMEYRKRGHFITLTKKNPDTKGCSDKQDMSRKTRMSGYTKLGTSCGKKTCLKFMLPVNPFCNITRYTEDIKVLACTSIIWDKRSAIS